mmetsp:Transcript_11450/g.51927  ORF Transcript_11450/g.51927 Transcript_11450/m.51927 type:complete len:205 (+) Transcript_11450:5028-5642(+)
MSIQNSGRSASVQSVAPSSLAAITMCSCSVMRMSTGVVAGAHFMEPGSLLARSSEHDVPCLGSPGGANVLDEDPPPNGVDVSSSGGALHDGSCLSSSVSFCLFQNLHLRLRSTGNSLKYVVLVSSASISCNCCSFAVSTSSTLHAASPTSPLTCQAGAARLPTAVAAGINSDATHMTRSASAVHRQLGTRRAISVVSVAGLSLL